MEIRKAKPDEFAVLRAFYDRVIDETDGMEIYARWKKGLHPTDGAIRDYLDEGCMHVMTDGETVVGAMALTARQDRDYARIAWETDAADDEAAVLHILAADPSRRGSGIGRTMVEEAIRLARAEEKKVLRLDALESNVPAQKLYSSLGFRYSGKLELYAENTGLTEFFFYELPLE